MERKREKERDARGRDVGKWAVRSLQMESLIMRKKSEHTYT